MFFAGTPLVAKNSAESVFNHVVPGFAIAKGFINVVEGIFLSLCAKYSPRHNWELGIGSLFKLIPGIILMDGGIETYCDSNVMGLPSNLMNIYLRLAIANAAEFIFFTTEAISYYRLKIENESSYDERQYSAYVADFNKKQSEYTSTAAFHAASKAFECAAWMVMFTSGMTTLCPFIFLAAATINSHKPIFGVCSFFNKNVIQPVWQEPHRTWHRITSWRPC